jgi:SRSO17 transposase
VAGKAEEIAQDLDPGAWKRLSAGDGTKGARLHDWAYCELADLDADEYDETESRLWTRGLLIRRTISDGDLAYFTTWCPAGTEIQMLVAVEGHRWAIEDSFETTKMSSASIITRAARGLAGIATSRSSCSPSP